MSNILCDICWQITLKFIEDACVNINIFTITLDIFIKVTPDEICFSFSSHTTISEAFLAGLSHSNFLILSEFRR
jgi:hypothetical protein